MNRIILIHHPANADVAGHITQRLGRIGIPFETVTAIADKGPGAVAALLQSTQEPSLLLITDNFLKDTTLMSDMLQAIQTARRERRVIILVADGRQSDDEGATWHAVPTHYERMVHALQYMNYWQNAWLELSDQHNTSTDPEEKERLMDQLNITRNIANEMGDFVAALRESDTLSLAQLEENHYALFFQRFGLHQWYDQYRSLDLARQKTTPAVVEEQPQQSVSESSTEQPSPSGVQQEEDMHKTIMDLTAVPPASIAPDEPIDLEIVASEPPHEAEEIPSVPPLWAQTAEEPAQVAPHFEETEPAFEELLPAAADAHTEIEQHIHDAWFWLNNGRTEQGLAILQTALENFPDNERLNAEYRKANALYSKSTDTPAKETIPPSPPPVAPAFQADMLSSEARSYELMGDMAYNKQDYLFAKYCWDRTIELSPDYPGIYRKLGGMVSEYMPEYRETGLQYLKNALLQDPKDAVAQLAAARLSLQNGENDAAEVYYRSATGLNALLKTPENDRLFLPEYAHAAVMAPERSFVHVQETPPPDDTLPEPVAEVAPLDETLPLASERQEEELPEAAEPLELPAMQELNDAEFDEPLLMEVGERMVALYPPPSVATEGTIAEEEGEMRAKPAASEAEEEAPVPEDIPSRQALTILVTGATSGIGYAIAALFAQNGHRLIVTGRRVERLAALKKEFETNWETPMLMLPFDVRDSGAVRAALENLPDGWQDIDILINNAGLAKGLAPIHEGDLHHWDTMIDTNLKGLLYVTRIVAPGMVRRRRGHIINVGSIAGHQIYPNGNVYCASKAGVDALTQAMRMDLYQHNIRVSQVSPGHVEATEFAINRFDGDSSRAEKVYENFQPLIPSDVAEVVYFMATRPPHVNIQDVVMFSTQQGSATLIDRSGR